MALPNPFRPTRFEHSTHALIWVSPTVYQLEGLKSVYLAGTRGSGKTSLLKALHWHEQLFNDTLRVQLDEPGRDYVSVYFRLPDFLSRALSAIEWKKYYPDAPSVEALDYELFSTIIEAIGGQLICQAFSTLRAYGRFRYTVDQERSAVEALIADYPPLAAQASRIQGLDSLSHVLRDIHRAINVSATRGLIGDTQHLLLGAQPGQFLNDLARSVKRLACSSKDICSPNFHIKVCVDDCESLAASQQKYLNSLVRGSTSPLFWVISFVPGDYDSTGTVVERQHLTEADRYQIDLDSESETDFRRLCESVTALRIYYSLPEAVRGTYSPTASSFGLDRLLGKPTVNQLLFEISKRSISPSLEALVERSRRASALYDGQDDEVPPIYETYVIERLGLRISDEARAGRTRNLEAYLRRKQRSALLTLCSEFRIKNIPYVGSRVVLSTSDGCIRDYLETMAVIVEKAEARGELARLESLLHPKKRLSYVVQRSAIVSASRQKYEGIRTSMERDWVEAMKVVECLGMLCARLQSDPATTASIANPERGVFTFDLSEMSGPDQNTAERRRSLVLRILKRCEADGLLRSARLGADSAEASSTHAYRLHRRFSPEFGYSYRGPYGAVRIGADDFARLCEAPNELSSSEWVDAVYSRVAEADSRQAQLPYEG